MSQMQRHTGADIQGDVQFGGRRSFGVDLPGLTLAGVQTGSSDEDLGHHGLLARARRRLGPTPATGGIDQRRITQRGEFADFRQETIEHA